MANQTNNIMESVVDAQKKMVDTVVENTKKVANGNAMVNDTMQKGSDWYKNWLENQKNFFAQTTDKATNATEAAKENAGKANEFYQNWFTNQMNGAKQMWEMNLDFMKNAQQKNTADTNPMSQWTNMMNNWNNWSSMYNNMNTANNWMNQMQNTNPFNMDAWKKSTENWTGIFNQYYEMLNNNMGDWQKNLQNGTTQDAYRNMVNMGEGFAKFYEMWMPMWKSIQEKTFNMEQYKEWMNPSMYKELMDKYFGFMPEQSQQYFQQMGNMMQENMKQAGQFGMGNYQQMRGAANNMFGGIIGPEMFTNLLNGYNNWYGQLQNSISPIVRMMTPNQHTKTFMEWNDIANRMMVYNIKNTEMQYMIYSQGNKVMDALAENIQSKIQSGEEINSIMALYQEWLNLSDKTFVGLFESDEYSKIMAEVSAMQLKLKKDVEGQMEKFMTGIPVATRSEMDEMYKTIYDLKKQVRQLEKMLDVDAEVEATPKSKGKKA